MDGIKGRAIARTREFAVRVAVGASRTRLLTIAVMETAILTGSRGHHLRRRAAGSAELRSYGGGGPGRRARRLLSPGPPRRRVGSDPAAPRRVARSLTAGV